MILEYETMNINVQYQGHCNMLYYHIDKAYKGVFSTMETAVKA